MNEVKEPFVLDERLRTVIVGNEVLFLEDGELCIRKVFNVRINEGNYEVLVYGPNGCWKRNFYKLAF